MKLPEFKLERFFAKYEFNVRFLLSASDCESLTMAELLEWTDQHSLQLWHNLGLGYTESAGHPGLREAVAQLYPGVTGDDILTAAPEEGIFIALNTILDKGDHVIVIHPAYQSLYEIPASLGCTVTRWNLEACNGSWYLDPDALEEVIKPETKLIIINFPHNPTGYMPAKEEYDRIIELARSKGIYIFSDEMYRLMEFETTSRLDAMAACYEKGISLSGLSKSFGLPGLRIGWLASRDRGLLKRFASFKDYTTICSSAPSEILAIMALQAKDKIIARNMEVISKNKTITEDFFAKYRDLFTWIPPLGGSVAFPRLDPRIPAERFCEELISRKNVMILPGTVFDYSGNHFRVGLGRRDFSTALQQVGDYLAAAADY